MDKHEWEAALTNSQRATLADWRAHDLTELENGEYPDPEDATGFIYVAWGKPVATPCPLQADGTRLVFNPTLKVCDFPSKVSRDDNPAFRGH